MRRTSGMPRIMSLILDSGSAGLRSKREPRRGGKINVSPSVMCADRAKSTNKCLQSQGTSLNELLRLRNEILDRHHCLIAASAPAQIDGAGRGFLLTDDQHVWD